MSEHDDHEHDKHEGHGHSNDVQMALLMLDSLERTLRECADTINAWSESCGLTQEQIEQLSVDEFPSDVTTAVLLSSRCGLAGHWIIAAMREEVWDALPFIEAYITFLFSEVEASVEITALEKMWGGGSDD